MAYRLPLLGAGGTVDIPRIIGPLVTVPYDSGSYTKTGSSFADTYGNTLISFTGSNIPNQNNYIALNNFFTDCENLLFVTDILFGSVGAQDFGGSVRILGQPDRLSLLVGAATGVNKGATQIYQNTTLVATGTTLATLNAGDTLRFTVRILKNVVSLNVSNLTSGGTAAVSFTYSFSSGGTVRVRPPAYTIGFGTSGGNYTFSNVSVTTSDLTLCDLMIVGDSKSYGLFAGGTDPAARFAGIWETDNPTKTIYVSSGSGERSSNMIQKLPMFTLYRPTRVIIVAPSNDPRNGVSQGDTETNLTTLKNHLEGRGAIVYYQNPFIENVGGGGVNQAGLVSAGANVFSAGKIIPSPWTSGEVGTYVSSDGIHPNTAAQALIKSTQAAVITL